MQLLVDSHIAIWWLDDPGRLSSAARQAIEHAGNEVFLSAASVWEVGLKMARGKLVMPPDWVAVLRGDGFVDLAVTVDHAEHSLCLPAHHGDPFDRLLIAQARCEGLVLVTRDAALRAYDVALLVG